ncbi:MAG: DoxX family protein [Alphaproteobacteria bacterium]|nr:DoxX family protein [Alphaproteobacteria bacterium]MBU1512550.1 DoxX family protein [Alphaproteobacteria bacterium]MBU2092889.1 DoxX family protein [Alphaproteobacteria bacterium]MBU2150872.1 DoxX family protein [Alphaproteobacteria bacterium]MBU2307917.1 DoxX family protein [Alphaproteobacteria bacterium]
MTDIAAGAAPKSGKALTIAGWTMTGLFTAFMAFDIGIKLVRLPVVEETIIGLHLPSGSGFAIGLLELAIVALYLFPRTALLGAVLIAALMGGTAGVNLVNAKPLFSHILFGPYLALFAWGGLWLRDATLRGLLPIRR